MNWDAQKETVTSAANVNTLTHVNHVKQWVRYQKKTKTCVDVCDKVHMCL